MDICYYGHSCFTLSSGGYTLAIDPYDDHVDGYPPLRIAANSVYCSHQHFDHCYVQAVDITEKGGDPFTVEEYEVPHDDAGGSRRGMNLIRVFRAEGKKIIHFGDTGCMPSDDILNALGNADIAMIPVGGFFTIDASMAKEILDVIKPSAAVPMHYRQGDVGLRQIAELKDFLDITKEADYRVVSLGYKETLSI